MMTRFIDRCPADIPYSLVVFDGLEKCGILLTDNMRARIITLGGKGVLARVYNMVRFLLAHREDLIVTSTWKMALLLFIANRFTRFRSHWSFTHRSSAAGAIDHLVRRWQVRRSRVRLADSAAAAAWIRKQGVRNDIVELMPIFSRADVAERLGVNTPPRLCFVGRLAPVKNLTTVFSCIEAISRNDREVEFDIYGPDAGELLLVKRWMARSISSRLRARYLGAKPADELRKGLEDYDFLISCSHTEGFALNVAEAMQAGVVPIVGNVGGPSVYCNSSNAVVLNSYDAEALDQAALTVRRLSTDGPEYARMSKAAKDCFANQPDFVEAYAALLRREFGLLPWSVREHPAR